MELKEPKRKRRVHVAARQPFPVQIESVTGIPVSSALWEVYTGIYNGDCVVVEAQEEMDALYNMIKCEKKYHLEQHKNTAIHMKNSGKKIESQPFFPKVNNTDKTQEQFSADLCSAMLAANIPWKKLENPDFNAFLNKYTNMKIPDINSEETLLAFNLFIRVLWPSENNDERFLDVADRQCDLHMTCLAHAVHRVAEDITSRFPNVNAIISTVKKVFLKAPSRILSFKACLPNTPLPPQPVLTRWGTWLHAALYYVDYLGDIQKVVQTFDEEQAVANTEANAALSCSSVSADLAYVKSNFGNLTGAITALEARDLPLVKAVKIIRGIEENLNQASGSVGTAIVDKFNRGFFGKGSLSRSAPVFGKVRQGVPPLVRQRQWLQRQKWAEKQSLMSLEFPDIDMMEPHNKRTFLETSELQPDPKKSRLETGKNNSNNSNEYKLQTSLTNNKLGNGLVSSSPSDDSKKVSSSVNLQEINIEEDIITLDSPENNKSVSKKDIHQKILEAVQSVRIEDKDISNEQGESLSTQSKILKQRCNEVGNQHLEIIETDQNKTINKGKEKSGECSEITLVTVHSDNEETKVLDSSEDYNKDGEAISLEDTDIVEVSNLFPDNKSKSFVHQVHSSEQEHNSEGNSHKSTEQNYLTNQEKTLSGKNEDMASEEVEIVGRSLFNPDSTKKACTQRKEIVVMEESLDENLFIDPNHLKETTTQGVSIENASVDDDKQVSKEWSTITKQNITKSSQDIEVVDLKNPETQGCKNKSSTVSTERDSGNFQQEDVLMEDDSEVSSTNKNGCNFKSKETSYKKHTKSLDQYSVEEKVLVVPDSDSEDETFLDHISPRIEPDVFPVREMLHLTLEEAFFLSYALGCLQVLDLFGNTLTVVDTWGLFSESQKDFVQKYVAYHHFRSKGWVVKPGLKFGGDFCKLTVLLYKQGPMFYHASYIVLVEVIKVEDQTRDIILSRRALTWTRLIGYNRVAEASGKEVLVCQVVWPSIPTIDSPALLSHFSVAEVLLRRWISSQEREDQDKDDMV
uniref:tRNA-intron lyase n=1 Tax=Timema shepardi TaxID=629360 RepID=A0A7R9G2W0_TIMSH|nr:unnamed protein product [Timema shepardi]